MFKILLSTLPKDVDVSVFESILNSLLDFVDILRKLVDSVLGWLPQETRYIIAVGLVAMIVIKIFKSVRSGGSEI